MDTTATSKGVPLSDAYAARVAAEKQSETINSRDKAIAKAKESGPSNPDTRKREAQIPKSEPVAEQKFDRGFVSFPEPLAFEITRVTTNEVVLRLELTPEQRAYQEQQQLTEAHRQEAGYKEAQEIIA